jgi:hypothetical protein
VRSSAARSFRFAGGMARPNCDCSETGLGRPSGKRPVTYERVPVVLSDAPAIHAEPLPPQNVKRAPNCTRRGSNAAVKPNGWLGL